ncbi:hypothetical protein T07_9259 [Trichinella nelsoni]|uniref:Uncharacterized protein n=1 Tax=Trichinella nelsoni TaxID=6336 RepID=A0A0V0S4Z9_9BILA|nr:hypothetical protein T07_9259 [Trichinella nelsoni]
MEDMPRVGLKQVDDGKTKMLLERVACEPLPCSLGRLSVCFWSRKKEETKLFTLKRQGFALNSKAQREGWFAAPFLKLRGWRKID